MTTKEIRILLRASILVTTLLILGSGASTREYTTYKTWDEVLAGTDAKYAPLVRVSDPGTDASPVYTGFWFFGVDQFDSTERYALGMKVYFQNRDVQPTDRADIGYFDLKNHNHWTKIGETTAWNWQQGARLQWRPRSDEILWNDHSDDGKSFVCRVYNFKSKARRTLPRPIYDVSSDGKFALTHDFARMKHGGTSYVGIPDLYAGQRAPAATGIWKMDMKTGANQLIVDLERMAKIAFPQGYSGETDLYFFREGWNLSGSRFIAFLKNSSKPTYTTGWSISADGKDIRFFYDEPSHHVWLDDQVLFEGNKFRLYQDDGSGRAEYLAQVDTNCDPTFLPGQKNNWILADTYPIKGYQYLFLYHRPSGLFVPLARLQNTAQPGIHRIDLHARASRNGRMISFDSSHEGKGRQMYTVDIGYILDRPPAAPATPPAAVR